jgi:AGCS family alanine or glycine:cation symporter
LNLKWLAVLFAIATVVSSFGSGNMPQSNNIASGMLSTFGIPAWITGLSLAILLGMVILGGIKRIVKVAEKLVPTMAVIYFVGGLAVIAANIEQVLPSFLSVIQDAFSGSAAAGGFLGASFAYAFNRGVNRGLFSNEAGQGSAPIAHAAARADEPISEGMVSILEPFIDTIIICSLTGLVILASGVWNEKHETDFQKFDTQFIAGTWHEDKPGNRSELFAYLNFGESSIEPFSGDIRVVNGIASSVEYTILHNRSIAEDVRFEEGNSRYTGMLTVREGKLMEPVALRGRSLVHSVDLTSIAFTRSVFG